MAPRRDRYGIPSHTFNLCFWFGLGVLVPVLYMATLPLIWPEDNPRAPLSRYLASVEPASQVGAVWIMVWVFM
jgi:hypothetical protein